MTSPRKALMLLVAAAVLLGGCRSAGKLPADARTARHEELVRLKWGKGISELPMDRLVLISPHNENITQEYEWAFQLHYALEFGRRVELEWRDVGGGGSKIRDYLLEAYANRRNPGIDIFWGGGEFPHMALARGAAGDKSRPPTGPLLERLELAEDVLANVPEEFAGLRLRDKDLRWIGSAASSFGFLYNAGMLQKCGIAPPARWADLGESRFTGLLTLANPGESGSVASTYLLIAQSAGDWSGGWARLLNVLSNAKRISDSAGAAANAPVLGDALAATCIDFYGLMRVAEAPQELVFVAPPGETTFGPDPIAILKDPPNLLVARRFVDFVMSPRGQALWLLNPGESDGPVRTALGRLPIRRDVYHLYGPGQWTPRSVNFYELPQTMAAPAAMKRAGLFEVVKNLTVAAAVDNIDALRRARVRLNELSSDPAQQGEYQRRLALFARLPGDADTLEKVDQVAKRLHDEEQFYNITVGWRDHFRATFAEVAR